MTTDAEFRQHRSPEAVAAAIAAHPEPYDDSFTVQPSAIAAVRRFAFADGFDAGVTSTAPRVVSTVAELDALPVGSILLAEGDLTGEEQYDKVAFTKGRRTHGNTGYKYSSVGSIIYTSEHFLETWESITVLWVGGTE